MEALNRRLKQLPLRKALIATVSATVLLIALCSAVTVFGMIVGAAMAHNFGLAGNADSLNDAKELVVGGISTYGKVAVVLGLIVMLVVGLMNLPKEEAT